MATTLLSSNGLKNSLKNYEIEESIIEYVWNGFDAGATRIDISEIKNDLGGSTYIKIKDNGSGIDKRQLDKKFNYVYESEKKNSINTEINTKGKKGVGRYVSIMLLVQQVGKLYIKIMMEKIINTT